MDVMEAIRNRHSYRGRYRDVPVPREDLVRIMQAGLDAPSGCNKQTTSLIAVDDPEILEKLRGVIDPPAGETAPAAICVLTRRVNAYRDRCFAVQDYSAAIENMLLAITALGYDTMLTNEQRQAYVAALKAVPKALAALTTSEACAPDQGDVRVGGQDQRRVLQFLPARF